LEFEFMKQLFLKTIMATSVLAIAAGCATPTGCRDSLELARQAADERRPSADWLDSVPAHCHNPAIEAWREALRAECAGLYAFDRGMNGKPPGDQCPGEDFRSAWNLGRMLQDLNDERELSERRFADESLLSPDLRRDLRQRLRVIERDLPQIQALARIQGFLPPARIPDRPENPGIDAR